MLFRRPDLLLNGHRVQIVRLRHVVDFAGQALCADRVSVIAHLRVFGSFLGEDGLTFNFRFIRAPLNARFQTNYRVGLRFHVQGSGHASVTAVRRSPFHLPRFLLLNSRHATCGAWDHGQARTINRFRPPCFFLRFRTIRVNVQASNFQIGTRESVSVIRNVLRLLFVSAATYGRAILRAMRDSDPMRHPYVSVNVSRLPYRVFYRHTLPNEESAVCHCGCLFRRCVCWYGKGTGVRRFVTPFLVGCPVRPCVLLFSVWSKGHSRPDKQSVECSGRTGKPMVR